MSFAAGMRFKNNTPAISPTQPAREAPAPRAPRESRNNEMRDILVSVRDFILTHEHQKYFKARWGPWKLYLDKIARVI